MLTTARSTSLAAPTPPGQSVFPYHMITFYSNLINCSVDIVFGYWANVAAWTGFCATRAIPYQNLADWFTYSSTVIGAVAKC
jgi:hypothetical protein